MKISMFSIIQYCFHKKRSTRYSGGIPHTKKTVDILNVKKIYTVSIFLDLSKANYRVYYEILIDKLYSMEIRGINYT